MPSIVVFSHLRWNFVYQRPQHLMSRLARHYRILFVEEPVPNASDNFLEHFSPAANVEILRPHVIGEATGFDDAHAVTLQRLVMEYLEAKGIMEYWAWF